MRARGKCGAQQHRCGHLPCGVNFGSRSNDPVYAVFAIAARTDEEHLVLFRALAKFISEEANVERLKGAATFEEIGF